VPHHNIVAIGGSAGALDAVIRLFDGLPADLPASLLLALHTANGSRTPEILSRCSPLPAAFGRDGEAIEPGRIYVAPPDRHLMLMIGDRLRLGAGPWENGARPAIDPLFRSCALCCGPRVIGLVLSGRLSDGSSGLQAIERCGGIAVVQDPVDAAHAEMPRNALRFVAGAQVTRLEAMPALLIDLIGRPAGPARPVPDALRIEVEIAADGRTAVQTGEHNGTPSLYTCPECHGTMRQIEEGKLTRFRCHTGHAYTADALHAAMDDDLRGALGSALRALDERVMLIRRLELEALESGHAASAARWRERATFYADQAELVRRVLVDNRPPGEG
jgi:two-component system chemotaxis response regulator CheB